jgi:Short C-terminal domain
MDENFSVLDLLVDSGALTEEEFQAQKARLLASA